VLRIAILLFDGFDELDAIAPFEVLKNAAAFGASLDVRLVALAAPRTLEASHGLRVQVDQTPSAFRSDWLLVPGGAWAARSAVGAWGEIQRGELPRAIAELRQSGASIASVCTGAMLLSAAGLTRGRRVATHRVARQALAAEGANVVDARVVDDGDLVSAGGVTAGLDLALWLVERLAGDTIARRVEAAMEYTRSGSVSRG
jgi:transcriptional regulator GlxA family with amidase domain